MISVIEAGPVARKILVHLGLPSVAPALGRARIDQGELFASALASPCGTGPPADHSQVPASEDLDQRTAFDAA